MASQFIRLNCYAQRARSGRMQHENAFDILNEAARRPGSTPHLRAPRSPVLLHGIALDQLSEELVDFAQTARNRRGGRLRRDETIIYAIVASYPMTWRELEQGADQELYAQWQAATLEWLTQIFGAGLKAVVEHVDEPRPHIHAFVIPRLDARNRIDHRFHPGHAARDAALGNGGSRPAGEKAYRQGMRAWQDGFYRAVSHRFGHDRVGPKRKRFRRDFALMRTSSDRVLASVLMLTERIAQRLAASDQLANAREQAEVYALGELLRTARNEIQIGRLNYLQKLDAAIAALFDDTSSDGIPALPDATDIGMAEGDLDQWDNDDDPRPDPADDFDLDIDDDPDPEIAGHGEDDVDMDDDADDRYDLEFDYDTNGN